MELILYKFGKGKNAAHYLIDKSTHQIWVDISIMPESVLLCALADATQFMQTTIANKIRYFITCDWMINEYGGYPELIDAVKKGSGKVKKLESEAYEKNDKKETNGI